MFSKKIVQNLHEKNLYLLSFLLFLIPIVISVFTVYWSPFLLERYHLDFYYLLCILSFITVASWLELASEKKREIIICSIIVLTFLVYIMTFLFFLLPVDSSYTYFYPLVLDEIHRGLRFEL